MTGVYLAGVLPAWVLVTVWVAHRCRSFRFDGRLDGLDMALSPCVGLATAIFWPVLLLTLPAVFASLIRRRGVR